MFKNLIVKRILQFYETMRNNISVILLIFIILPGCKTNKSSFGEYLYPIKRSEGNRFLTDQNGNPFFWSGDAAWSLIVQLKREEVDYYLDDRKQKGFTVLLVNLIEH